MHEGLDVRGPQAHPSPRHQGPSTSRAGHDGCPRGPTTSWRSLHIEADKTLERPLQPPPELSSVGPMTPLTV